METYLGRMPTASAFLKLAATHHLGFSAKEDEDYDLLLEKHLDEFLAKKPSIEEVKTLAAELKPYALDSKALCRALQTENNAESSLALLSGERSLMKARFLYKQWSLFKSRHPSAH